jgi:lipoprotein-releasing system permease protein
MFGPFERMLAMRYLRARRQEGFISVIAAFSLLGIGLGVATLIIVMAVMNGFRHELLGRILGLNGHLNVFAVGQPMTDYNAIADRVSQVRGVIYAVPTIEAQALITSRGFASGALVRALKPDDFRSKPIVSQQIKEGSLADFGEDRIAIGRRMADRLALKVGDRLTLISPKGTTTPFGTMPRMRAYPIAAVFEIGMFEYDNTFVFMPLEAAQAFMDMPDAVSSIEVLTTNPNDLQAVRPAILEAAGPSTRIVDWQQANGSFFNALQVERTVMFLILTLIILVAAFNIISSLIMLVKDKGRDIAILRTMGATRGMVMRIFFLTGASVGVIGTLAGFVLGVAFSSNIETIRQWIQGLSGTMLFDPTIYFLSRLPAKMDWTDVGYVVAMALGLSLAATIYPSWRAARLDPVEGLRHE